jgi:formylglycine-generating enzyme required for sulfatase activity
MKLGGRVFFVVFLASSVSLVLAGGCSSSSSPPSLDDNGDGSRNDVTTTSDTGGDHPQPGSCTDGKKDGQETDVDCGGPACPKCGQGKSCLMNSDCDPSTMLVCGTTDGGVGGICVGAGCTDGIKDGMETGVDCGGPSCGKCPTGQGCAMTTDCQSGVCSMNLCAAATCTDGVKNGQETDVDCGGPMCKGCLVGKACMATTDCQSKLCNGGTCACPPSMIVMPTLVELGAAYCIDATEITKAQYYAFWLANPQTLPTYCTWKKGDGGNAVYTPAQEWPPTLTMANYNGGDPVHWIDWCDAFMYCQWASKNLCGKIGGGSNLTTDYAKRDASEWYNACSAEGVNIYPYGGSYNGQACNGADYTPIADAGHANAIYPVQDFSGIPVNTLCQGGASGLYQMSGNVAEWEDSCDLYTGETDNCLVRGGSFSSSQANLACNVQPPTQLRNTRAAEVGFRCCL